MLYLLYDISITWNYNYEKDISSNTLKLNHIIWVVLGLSNSNENNNSYTNKNEIEADDNNKSSYKNRENPIIIPPKKK